MNTMSNNYAEYVYYEESEIVYDDEYVNNRDPADEVENVLPSQTIPKQEKIFHSKDSASKRPGHCKTVENVYDELDYELSPRVGFESKLNRSNDNEAIKKESGTPLEFQLKLNFHLSKRSIIIMSIFSICLFGAIIVGVVVFLQGKQQNNLD